MTRPYRGVRRGVSPESLHSDLRSFTWHLRRTLNRHTVTSLGRVLATLGVTPGSTWADVRAAGSAWRVSAEALRHRWGRLAREATELRGACRDAATTEASAAKAHAAIATHRAWYLQDKATHQRTAGDNQVAAAQQPPMAPDREEVALAGATHKARVAAATNEERAAAQAMREAMVAKSQARVATRRGQQAEVALGPLKHLVAACDEATTFPQELQWRLRAIEATL
ncbi:uncharacterized protein LOC128821276 [Vidua macroura]|uniref:uncharacterized protein LOC128821276 n=1 Tax=Vidua macroura TaxID=187451 RepID=UPI0023A80E32|nr:uncharacterized protein LOC128821276 [Vidua macroura]XP_053858207.1 uncharacterized protein LOC128821276 [Vidua macroura]